PLAYLRFTGRPPQRLALVEAYAKAQGMFHTAASPDPEYTDTLELDLATVEPSLAGPRRPHDRVALRQSKTAWLDSLPELQAAARSKGEVKESVPAKLDGVDVEISNGAVVVAAITSCTNTSHP